MPLECLPITVSTESDFSQLILILLQAASLRSEGLLRDKQELEILETRDGDTKKDEEWEGARGGEKKAEFRGGRERGREK